jgi:molybdate transport system regulatory protein
MNSVPGIVESITKDDLFSIVRISSRGHLFSAAILLAGEEIPYCRINANVVMTFKEADTFISLHDEKNVSCRNRFVSRITDMVQSQAMSRITVDFKGIPIISLITTASAQFLNLEKGMDVVCMVKATSMMLYAGE